MKQQILEKASNLFLKYGVKSVTMDDIASKMAISKKTLYKYFENKDTLVEQATTQIHQSCLAQIYEINAQNFSPIKENFTIKKMFREMFQNMDGSYLFQLKKYYPKIYNKIIKIESTVFLDCIKQNIEKGIAQGYYRKELNIEVVANFYLSLVFSIYEKDILQNELLDLEFEALLYHTRAIATVKGIQELENQLKENKK